MLNFARAVNLTEVPVCGISCLAAALQYTTCSSTNETCLCTDQDYNNWVTSCVVSNCTIKDQLRTQRATELGCGVTITDNSEIYTLLGTLLFSFNSVFFFLRIANRVTRMAPWGWDDTTCVIAWLLTVCFLGGTLAEVQLGIGKPYWALQFWQIDATSFVYFICEVIYCLTLGMVKASICFLYIRIFQNTTFRRVVWATQAFNGLLVLAFVSADFGQCRPLSHFWYSWDGDHDGVCFNINAYSKAHSAINIALDFWMLILPATQIWKLNMSTKRKCEAMAIFAVGLFLTAVSIVRFWTLSDFYKDPSSAKGYYDTGIWTSIELTVGVIVACLPAARIFVAEHTSEIIKSMKASGLWSRSCKSDLPSYHKASSSLKRSTFQLTLASRLGGPRLMDAISRELGGDCYPNRRCGSHDELVDMSSHSTDEDLKT